MRNVSRSSQVSRWGAPDCLRATGGPQGTGSHTSLRARDSTHGRVGCADRARRQARCARAAMMTECLVIALMGVVWRACWLHAGSRTCCCSSCLTSTATRFASGPAPRCCCSRRPSVSPGAAWPLRRDAASRRPRQTQNGPPCWRRGNRWSRRMIASGSRRLTAPHTPPIASASDSTTGAYGPISCTGATERPTSSGLSTGLWVRNQRTQTTRWCDRWNDAVRHDPSAVYEVCRVRTSGGASARFATSRAIIRRRTIAVAHWNDAET